MPVQLRPYTSEPGYSADAALVHDLLARTNHPKMVHYGMTWVRWEWMLARGLQDGARYERCGLWLDGERLVGVALHEDVPGQAWLVTDPAYTHLRPEMLAYACERLAADGKLAVSIDDSDREMQRIAAVQGFRPTTDRELTAVLEITPAAMRYTLPAGYRLASLADELDMARYNRVMWRGFNHEGPAPDGADALAFRRNCVSSPHANQQLYLVVVAPDGEFVAHCGVWYLPGDEFADIEPVATDPAYRRMGLGRAAVLEAVRRAGELGARMAYVGSSQPFYYGIGFWPCASETFWQREV